MALTVQLPKEVVDQKFVLKNTFLHVDAKSATLRAAERTRCFSVGNVLREVSPCATSEASTAESPRYASTSIGSRVPAFLEGCESPQTMRCAAPPRAGAQMPTGFAPMAFVLPGYMQYMAPYQYAMGAPMLPMSPMLTPTVSPASTPPGSPTHSSGMPVAFGNDEKKSKKRSRTVPPARENETTVLLRNISRDLSPQDVWARLKKFRAVLDFVYVPIEFETKCNLGYAFLNVSNKAMAPRMEAALAELFGAEAFMQPARVQGLAANVKRFRNSSVMAVLPEEFKPMVFHRGEQVPFPEPTKKLPPVGPRFRPTVDQE